MSGEPSRRPSTEHVRVVGDVNALVWVECPSCLGDGWHYPQVGVMVDRLRPTRKLTCRTCGGLGARQTVALLLTPNARIVPAPKGRHDDATGER